MVSWASCYMVQMLAEYHWFYSREEREVRWLGGGSEKLPRVLPVQLRGEYDYIFTVSPSHPQKYWNRLYCGHCIFIEKI